jgi:hypothetical protein
MGDSSFNTNCYAMVSQIYGTGRINTSNSHNDEYVVDVDGCSSGTRAINRATNTEPLLSDSHNQQCIHEPQYQLNTNSISDIRGIAINANDHKDNHDTSSTTKHEMENTTTNVNSVVAFSVFQLIQNLGSALGYILGIFVPFHASSPAVSDQGSFIQIILQVVLLLISVIGFHIVDVKHRS